MCGVEVLVCLGIGAAAGGAGGCYGRHKCAACCGNKGKVVKGQDETVVKNADLHNAKQGGLISKALNRGASKENKENAWGAEEQRAFNAQNQRAAAANPHVYENYQLEYGAPYKGAAGKDPEKKGSSSSWLKNATKLGKSS